MDCPRARALPGLPDDIIVDILSRVPVESIRELKLVSRAWRHIIADPFHRKSLPQTLEGFFHGEGGGGNGDTYGRFTIVPGGSGPEVDPSFSFLTKLPWIERMVLIDSCNGLLLFECARNPDCFGYIVCNPLTKELVFVPSPSGSPPPGHLKMRRFIGTDGEYVEAYTFVMFDPVVSSHFRLIQLWQHSQGLSLNGEEVGGVHFYSSETRGWSDRSSEWKRGEEGGEWEQWGQAMIMPSLGTALVDGMLHFVVRHYWESEDLIVAVDGEGKTCWILYWPGGLVHSDASFIGQSHGRLHCISANECKLSVWVLEDYVEQEWILKHCVSCSEVFGVTCPRFQFNVVAIHPDRNVIFFVRHWNNKKLVSYDMDSGELHALYTLGDGYWPMSITPYVPYLMESAAFANKD